MQLRMTLAIAFTTAALAAGCASTTTGNPIAAPADAVRVEVLADGQIRVGTVNAKTTLDIYEDPRCPACASFEKRDGDDIQAAIYGGTVAVRYQLLDFLNRASTTQYSTRAIAAALCTAADQRPKTYFAFHTALFSKEHQPSEGADDPSDSELAQLASTAGASANAVQCVKNKSQLTTATAAAKAALTSLKAANLSATPSVVHDGKVIDLKPNWLDPLK